MWRRTCGVPSAVKHVNDLGSFEKPNSSKFSNARCVSQGRKVIPEMQIPVAELGY